MVFFIFIQVLTEYSCEQTVDTLRHLVWVFTVCLCPRIIFTLGISGCNMTTRVIFYVLRIGLYLYKYRIYGTIKDNVIHNMAWWLKSAGALNFALSQEQCPISL